MQKNFALLLVTTIIFTPATIWAEQPAASTIETSQSSDIISATIETSHTNIMEPTATSSVEASEYLEPAETTTSSSDQLPTVIETESSLPDKQETETAASDFDAVEQAAPKMMQATTRYATIVKSSPIVNQKLETTGKTTDSHLQQTFKIAQTLVDNNQTVFHELINQQNQSLGFVVETALALTDSPGGIYLSKNQYVTLISKNYDIWQNFTWQKRDHSSKYYGKVYQARGYYQHYNGNRYLTLYDSQGKWLGYLNERGTQPANNKVGIYLGNNRYVTIKSRNYDIWQNFSWQKRNHSANYYGQMLQTRGYYQHYNGSRYLTLYDRKGSWIGYMNEVGTNSVNPQGNYRAYGEQVIINSNFTIWRDFTWKKKADGNQYRDQTFIAKGYYQHFNGSVYLSLWENTNQWLGYINAEGVKFKPKTPAWPYVSLQKKDQPIWRDFQWQQKNNTTQLLNQTFKVKVSYKHYNGKTYDSIYDKNNKWQGYIESSAVTGSKNPEGKGYAVTDYYRMEKTGYSLYENFRWQKKQASNALVGQIFQAREQFHHFNGSVYVSLYSERGEWQGYINRAALNKTSAAQFVDKENLYKIYRAAATFKRGIASDSQWQNFQTQLQNAKNILNRTATKTQVDQAANALDRPAQFQFIYSIAGEAQKITRANDLYTSVMLAQAILESGYGRSELAYQAQNFFGVKFNVGQDEGKYGSYAVVSLEYIDGEYVPVRSLFRKYANVDGSLKDNALKLSGGVAWDKNYYQGAWRSKAKTYQDATKALTGKYATDPDYHHKLNRIIANWSLDQYD